VTIPDDVRAEWRGLGLHGDITLAELTAKGFAQRAASTKVYRSEQRPRTATLGDIDRSGRKLASTLTDLGLRPGDVIALQLPNWFENDVTIRAAVHLGLVFLPIVHIYGIKELDFILRESGAKALVVPDRFRRIDFRERIDAIAGSPSLEHVIVTGRDIPPYAESFDDVVDRGADDIEQATLDADDVCALVYTSGTTADPKGVQHTHNTLLAERGGLAGVQQGALAMGDKPALQLFPAGHIAAALGTIFLYSASATTVCFDTFDPDGAVQAIEEFGLAGTSGAPFFLSRILDVIETGERDLSCLESFVVGAASVPPSLVERAERLGLKAVRCYGSSEHPTVTISRPDDSLEIRAQTDGRCLPGNRVRIIGEDGKELPQGHVGEIVTLGPELFVGYRDASLDADAFMAGGWFRTGDLGRLDDNGCLTVTDRLKDIIIRGGENISAAEVEDVLTRHPAIADVAVVSGPDEELGEKVCAFIVVRGDAHIDLTDVAAWFRAKGMARPKTPERIELVDELPRTQSGKVQKAALRRRLRAE
jgi:acyl-CoA synthetase (AMP-forming)/AMP-acid ligase II